VLNSIYFSISTQSVGELNPIFSSAAHVLPKALAGAKED